MSLGGGSGDVAILMENKLLKKQSTKSDQTVAPSNQRLILCTKDCRYNVIKRVCRKMDIKLDSDENADWDIYWSDVPVQPERVQRL